MYYALSLRFVKDEIMAVFKICAFPRISAQEIRYGAIFRVIKFSRKVFQSSVRFSFSRMVHMTFESACQRSAGHLPLEAKTQKKPEKNMFFVIMFFCSRCVGNFQNLCFPENQRPIYLLRRYFQAFSSSREKFCSPLYVSISQGWPT